MTGVAFTYLLYRLNKQYRVFSNAIIGNYFEPHRDIVLVTGGASGLGSEIVFQFVEKKGKVVVLDLHLPTPENRIEGVHYYKCDVSNRRDVLKVSEKVSREVGPVSILINNAGITTGKSILDLTYDEIEKTIQINLLASFYTIKAYLPNMIQSQRGYIITVASVLGYMSPARLSAYGASKSGLIALHESLTYELGPPSINPSGVKTLLICPGQLKTRMFHGVRTPSTLLAPELDPSYVAKSVVSAVELGRRGEIRLPFYGNFLPILRAAPWQVVEVARSLSGIDDSMQSFVGTVKAVTEKLSNAASKASSKAASRAVSIAPSSANHSQDDSANPLTNASYIDPILEAYSRQQSSELMSSRTNHV